MHPVGILHSMPKNKTKQLNEEQAVSNIVKELEILLQQAKGNAVDLEKEFDKYTQVHSQTCAKKVNGCESDKTDQKSETDAQSSTQGWLSWAFSLVRLQKTESDGDQIIPKGSEIQMQSSLQTIRSRLQKNRELIVRCQEKLNYLSQENLVKSHADLEKQNQDLLKKQSGSKETSALKRILGTLNPMKLFSTQPEKQNVTLQLYCQQQADLKQSIMTELTENLRSDCSRDGIELKEEILELATDINPDLPLMVICLHASRLGPDISDAIRGIKSGPSVAVLIVHHKDIFALPTERSDEILLEEEYREIGAIIDVAFMAGKGMYKCDMNKRAIEEIIKFIKRKGINNIKP